MLIYYQVKKEYKWVFLLVFSYFLYCFWSLIYLPFIIFSTLIDYFSSYYIHKSKNNHFRKAILLLSIFLNIGILLYFKYFAFILENIAVVFNLSIQAPEQNLFLPLGISFYTFQTMGYTLDVYWKRILPEKNVFKFALFVSYFPQLVSGPIEKTQFLLPQLEKPLVQSYEKNLNSLMLICWGFFKKMVLADNLLPIYKLVFADVHSSSPEALIFATILMTFVYYLDFSGYCDVAVGVSRLFGINLSRNFRLPYLSRSMGMVWKTWHITLGIWVKDYLYFYLSNITFLKKKSILLILVCFSVLGLWHGSNWNFFFFGFFHAVFLILDFVLLGRITKIFDQIHPLFTQTLDRVKVFLIWNLVGIFLISADLKEALEVFRRIFNFSLYTLHLHEFSIISLLESQKISLLKYNFYLISILALLAIGIEIIFEKRRIKSKAVRWAWVFILINIIFVLGSFEEIKFLYFKF